MLRLFPITVHSYSGYKANEKPLSFILNNKTHTIQEILDQWYGLSETYFKVRCNKMEIYLLKYDQKIDKWFLEQEDSRI